MPVHLTVDQEGLQSLARALKAEADGKKLRRDLAKNLRAALEPAKAEVRSNLMAMTTAGLSVDGSPLRASILKNLKAEARLTGRSTGARLRIKKTPTVRGFANAPKRLNRKKGWRHPVYGRDVWVHQLGKPDYFDLPLRTNRAIYRAAVRAAMEDMAERIARSAKA